MNCVRIEVSTPEQMLACQYLLDFVNANFDEDPQDEASPLTQADFANMLEKGHVDFYVLQDSVGSDTRIKSMLIVANHGISYVLSGAMRLELFAACTASGARRQGNMRALLSWTIQRLREQYTTPTQATLFVTPKSENKRKLYEEHGFTESIGMRDIHDRNIRFDLRW